MMKPQCGKNLLPTIMRSGVTRILATVLGCVSPNHHPFCNLPKTIRPGPNASIGSVSQKSSRRRALRERSSQPLILCGHGVLLRVEKGAPTIRNGFTHYPQKQETYRFFKGELTIPPRIIMLDGSGSVSFDVLAWLSEQNVSLIRIDWQGNVQTVLANNGYGSVVGCGCVDWNSKHVVGNVQNTSLKQVWQSQNALEFRTAFSNNNVPNLCKDCSLYISVDHAFSRLPLKNYDPKNGLYYNQ
jgi:radical SAM protein with 4Fe4S-binding SPASM domain